MNKLIASMWIRCTGFPEGLALRGDSPILNPFSHATGYSKFRNLSRAFETVRGHSGKKMSLYELLIV